ncbi:MAG TPA: YkvA family protein [Acidimicrobiia bacterium]
MSQESQKVTPDEVITPDGARLQSRRLIAEVALLLPNIVKLVTRLLRDPRVPRRAKITLGLAAAYTVSPIDLIPEVIPVLGWADDVLIIMFAIDSLIDRAGPEVVTEHWDGPGDILSMVREVVGVSRSIIPRRLASVIDRLSG